MEDELWDPVHSEPLGVGPLIEVDTTREVAIDQLAERVRALASAVAEKRSDPE
ncbi:hypothetical protein [Candidatus Nephthysia bennettiae]|uniref:hypothetical protein n=1 Tax=Candidatus Nephthysia bennettiae TaxID=3127016 RepID=UPI0030C69C5E